MRVKQPVSVGGIEFDALIDETRTLSATVPQYAVEKGYSVSDNVVNEAEALSMTLFLSNTPVTWYARHGSDPNRVETVVKQLEELYFNREPVTVITSDKTYIDMAIESIEIRKSLDIGYAREIPISFKKVRITEARAIVAGVPDSYGKSGTTMAYAGTANVSVESTNADNSDGENQGNGASFAYGIYETGRNFFYGK